MSEELVPYDGQLPAVQSEKALEEAIGSGDYVPYVMLHASNGKYQPEIDGGLFLLIADKEPEILGISIDVVLLEYRMLAMKYGSWGQEREYDPTTERWEHFKKNADAKTEEADGSRYYWGVEYLLYLPDRKEVVTFYCNNPTQRRVAKDHLKTKMRHQLTWTQDWIVGSKHKWWGFKVTPCDIAYDPIDIEEATKRIEEFRNPELATMPEGAEKAPEEEIVR